MEKNALGDYTITITRSDKSGKEETERLRSLGNHVGGAHTLELNWPDNIRMQMHPEYQDLPINKSYEVVLVDGSRFSTFEELNHYAERSGYKPPLPGMMPPLAEALTPKDLHELGWCVDVTALHEPIPMWFNEPLRPSGLKKLLAMLQQLFGRTTRQPSFYGEYGRFRIGIYMTDTQSIDLCICTPSFSGGPDSRSYYAFFC